MLKLSALKMFIKKIILFLLALDSMSYFSNGYPNTVSCLLFHCKGEFTKIANKPAPLVQYFVTSITFTKIQRA